MFLKNKYYRWYYQIVSGARKRGVPEFYSEKHHVIPKCMGGKNDWWNMVDLTYKEHYLVHWLLTKMTDGEIRRKMRYALVKMSLSGPTHNRIIAGWQYDISRKAARDAQEGVRPSQETIKKIVEARKGYRHSDETKLKMAKSPRFSGRKHSLESRLKMGRPKITLSEDHKRKIGLANKNKKRKYGAMNKTNEARKFIFKEFALKIGPVVKEIRDSGVTSLSGIAKQLNDRGIRTFRGGEAKWRGSVVRQYL